MTRLVDDLKTHPHRLLWALPIGFLALFYCYPLTTILGLSLTENGALTLRGFAELSRYAGTLAFTTGQALLSTVLTLGLALPGAYVFAHYRFPGKRLLAVLSLLPFVLPTVVVAAAFSALLGTNGLLNRALVGGLGLAQAPIQLEQTLALILMAHVFYNYAIALRLIAGYWTAISPRMEEAARVLGARGWRLWWAVRLPLLRPALWSAGLLVFIFTFTSFGVVLILGGARFATLEVEIYRQTTAFFDLPAAAALALVQLGLMFGVMLLYTRLQRRIVLDVQYDTARPPRTPGEWALVVGTLALMGVLLFAPLVALVVRSFLARDSTLTLANYAALTQNPRGSVLFVPPMEAVSTSLGLAAGTTVLAVCLGMLAAYLLASRAGRWLDAGLMLPLATSSVTLGLGLFLTFDAPPLNLRTSPALVLLAHTLVALPFVVRSILPSLRAIPAALGDSARMLGASPLQVWWHVDLPLLRRGVLVGAAFAFTISMGEFGASAFVVRAESATIPVAIARLLGQPGAAHYGQALALSVILMVACLAGFVLIERLGASGREGF